ANAAAQLLHAANDPGQPARRLELVLSADGQRAAATPGGGVAAAEGIVVAGDRVFELSPSAANASLMGGTLIARVEGAPANAPGAATGGPGLPAFGTGSGRSSASSASLALPGSAVGGR